MKRTTRPLGLSSDQKAECSPKFQALLSPVTLTATLPELDKVELGLSNFELPIQNCELDFET